MLYFVMTSRFFFFFQSRYHENIFLFPEFSFVKAYTDKIVVLDLYFENSFKMEEIHSLFVSGYRLNKNKYYSKYIWTEIIHVNADN